MKQGFSITLQPTKQQTLTSNATQPDSCPNNQRSKPEHFNHRPSKLLLRLQKSLKKVAADESLHQFGNKSLFCIRRSNKLRRFLLKQCRNSYFNNVIFIFVILNSICLALYDYEDRTAERKYNYVLNILNIIFGIIFLIEAIMKIIAFGFMLHPESYMRSPLNILDFSLVLIGIVEMLYFFKKQPYNNQLNILRGFRVLRPLKIVNAMPRMRKIFNTLIASMNQLVSVFIFIIYLFIIFGLIGVQLFQGAYQYQCILQTDEGFTVPQPNALCDINMYAGKKCPFGQFCGDPRQYLDIQQNQILTNPNLEYGMGNFNDFLQALISVFQIISQDNVGIKTINLLQTNWSPLVVIYLVMIILLGSYFALKIILAVIILAFKKMQQQKELEEQKRLKELEVKKKKRVVEALQTISQKMLKQRRGSAYKNEGENFTNQVTIVRETPEFERQSPSQGGASENTNKENGLNTYSSARSSKSLKSHGSSSPNQVKQDFFKLESDGSPSKNNKQTIIQTTVPPENDPDHLEIPLPTEENGQENIHISPIFTQKLRNLDISPNKKINPKIERQERKLELQRKQSQNIERRNEFYEIKKQVNKKFENQKGGIFLTVKNAEQMYTNLIRESVQKAYKNHVLAKSIEGFQYEDDRQELAQSIRHEIIEQFQRKKTFDRMSRRFNGITHNKFKIDEEIEKSKHDLEQIELEDRNEDRKIYSFFYMIISNKSFPILINIAIILNAIVLALDSSYNSSDMKKFLSISNMVFTAIFLLEMIIKLLGLGIKLYFKDKFNIFDFLIILVSLIDISLQQTIYKENFAPIRAFRIFRLFKIAKSWVQLQNIITIIYQTLQDLSAFGILLLTFIFTYTLVGMEWFAYKVRYNKKGELDFQGGEYPDANFNTIYQSFYIVFEVLTTDGWSEKFFRYYQHAYSGLASLFFITLMTFGQYILLMLFIAILIENFDESSINQAQKERENNGRKKSMIIWFKKGVFKGIYQKFKQCNRKLHNRYKVSESQEDKGSLFKVLICKIVKTKYFDFTVLALILLSTVIYTIDNPLADPNSKFQKALNIIDWIITILFVFEIIMKCIAYGIYYSGPKSYLKSWFNIIDVLIVLISTSIGALVRVMPNVINILLIAMLLLFIFAIMALNIFKGLFYYCHSEKIESLPGYQLSPFDDKWDCLNLGGEYLTYDSQYNNIQHALAAIMKICQAFNWTAIMFQSTRISGENLIPKYNAGPGYAVFFIVFMTFSYFFITNLFVGVLVSSFNREKEKLGQKYLLTEEQFRWLQTKLLVLQAKPKFYLKAPVNKLRYIFYKIAVHKKFEKFILGCIFANTFILCLEYHGQQDKMKYILLILNLSFSGLFLLEAFIKIMGFGRRYFKENWNIFDFVTTFLQIGANLVEMFPNTIAVSMAGIRVFRTLKFFHVFRITSKINIIFQTFISTLPALLNVGSLLLLMFYIFAILAQKLFAEIKISEPLVKEDLNFQGVGSSLLSMFLMSNGDIFYQIAQAVTNENSVLYQCIENPTYEDYKNNNYEPIGCGNKTGGFIIFTLFAIVVILIFINIFIAIIIQSYEDTSEKSHKVFNESLCEQFREVWSHYDKNATGFINIEDLPDLMLDLGPPLGWDSSYKDNLEKQENFIHQFHFPTYKDTTQFAFMDVIENLVLMRIVNQEVQELIDQDEEALDNRLIEQKITKSVNMIGQLKEAEQNENIEIVNQVQKNKTRVIRIDQDTNNSINKKIMKAKFTSKLSWVNQSVKRSAPDHGSSPPRKVFEIKLDEVDNDYQQKNSEFDSFQFELSQDINSESA